MARLLYHYTNAAGLIGILRSEKLWASDAWFLNDSMEIIYARDQMLAAIRRESAKTEDPTRAKILRFTEETMRDPTGHELPTLYVSCFCEDGDLLSQWRAYGREQGFAIGFDPEVLQQIEVTQDARSRVRQKITDIPPYLLHVVYGEDPASIAISQAIETMGYGQSGGGHYGVVAVNEVAWYVLPVLCRIKHPTFREEREWRLVYVIWYDQQEQIARFRPSSIGIVPYIEVPLTPSAIRQIVLGPGNHLDTRRDGVKAMLRTLGRNEIEVEASDSPLRAG
jgi:hypothetical protein